MRIALPIPTAAMAIGPNRPTMRTSTTLTKLCNRFVTMTGSASRTTRMTRSRRCCQVCAWDWMTRVSDLTGEEVITASI